MESVSVINFKKVVSMIVMLSLMLGACGKSPARRNEDAAMQTNDESRTGMGREEVVAIDSGDTGGSEKNEPTFGKWWSEFWPWSAHNKDEYKDSPTYGAVIKKWWGGLDKRKVVVGAVVMIAALGIMAWLKPGPEKSSSKSKIETPERESSSKTETSGGESSSKSKAETPEKSSSKIGTIIGASVTTVVVTVIVGGCVIGLAALTASVGSAVGSARKVGYGYGGMLFYGGLTASAELILFGKIGKSSTAVTAVALGIITTVVVEAFEWSMNHSSMFKDVMMGKEDAENLSTALTLRRKRR